MADDLQTIYQELEERVESRTAMLREAQVELERMALTDPLTQLANRTALNSVLSHALAESSPGRNAAGAPGSRPRFLQGNQRHPGTQRRRRRPPGDLARGCRTPSARRTRSPALAATNSPSCCRSPTWSGRARVANRILKAPRREPGNRGPAHHLRNQHRPADRGTRPVRRRSRHGGRHGHVRRQGPAAQQHQGVRARPCSMPAGCRASWSPKCAKPSSRTSSPCTTSPWWNLPPAGSKAWRRWSAGTTRNVAC